MSQQIVGTLIVIGIQESTTNPTKDISGSGKEVHASMHDGKSNSYQEQPKSIG